MLLDVHDKEERNQLVRDIESEIEELNRLVRELMTFSALDTTSEKMETVPIVLHESLSDIVAYHRKTHTNIEIVLRNNAEKNLTVNANRVYFKRAVQNILSNALRHAKKKVSLCYSAEKGGIRIDVLDDGPGIPENVRKAVFQPFTRLDSSRNRNSGGFGLGLAIVDRILSLHGGTVSIGDNSPRGVRITTRWPAAH
jgi:two-component system sensor histidine kinase RstB